MKKHIIYLFCLIAFSSTSQNILSEKYNLMPWPQNIEENNLRLVINSDVTISIIGNDNQERIRNAAVNFLRRLSGRTGVFINEGFPIDDNTGTIQISFDKVSSLNIESDESYSIEISNINVLIKASTDVGALRALETLLQLTSHNSYDYYFPGVAIRDAPRFVWRGLMIDVARHFQPIDVIKRNLDAMASVKMNVFHWHLTDDQGFRIESKVYPKLQELASDGLYYTQDQIKEIVKYASNLGIRVIPEIDVPGHASAILTAYPEQGSKDDYNYAIERFAGVFNPTLNPTKEITYKFLDNLFTEVASLFPDPYFHIGGDENEGKHWDENENIQAFKKEHSLKTNHDLQTYFNIKLEKILNKSGKKLMGWDEIMTPNIPTTAVIHSWRGEQEGQPKGGSLIGAAKSGYQTVLSNGYYIDRMLSVEHHYSVDPIGYIELTKEERACILGGEATMWSELVTPLTIDSRIWPRTAAIAERFWSPKEVNNIENMKWRLKDVSNKLEELGITHIKNRDVILRNISGYQNIDALKVLSNVCEPLKMYSRNKGGTEYKTFSPFTLFADACVVDAEDAVGFKKTTFNFIENSNNDNTNAVLDYLKKWKENHKEFTKIANNPNVISLESLSSNLSKASKLLASVIKTKKITKEEFDTINRYMKILSDPHEDVELVIVKPLNTLILYCKENYFTP
jgi:hexosaminidase